MKIIGILEREIVTGMRLLGATSVRELVPEMVRGPAQPVCGAAERKLTLYTIGRARQLAAHCLQVVRYLMHLRNLSTHVQLWAG